MLRQTSGTETAEHAREGFISASFHSKSISAHQLITEAERAATLRRLVRAEIKTRFSRKQFLNESLFSDPAWDILIELFAAELEGGRLSVSAVGLRSSIPSTTALRWLSALQQHGLVARIQDPKDGRRAFLSLTPVGSDAMTCYFENSSRFR